MKKYIKIGQISDIHIGEDDSLVQGINVRKNFLHALNSEAMQNTDFSGVTNISETASDCKQLRLKIWSTDLCVWGI